MKKLGVGIIGLCVIAWWAATAQEIDEINGKTYYYFDNNKKQIKEVFHHIRTVKFGRRGRSTGPEDYYDTVIYIKNGPYLKYYITGQLECSGYYLKDKKDSLWIYYNQQGKVTTKERYINGALQP